MDVHTFKRVLTTFADAPANVDLSKGKLLCEVRDEVIEADLSAPGGEVVVTEAGVSTPANKWLFQRVARLSILADRIGTAFTETPHFISPKAELLDQIDRTADDDTPVVGDAVELTLEVLNRHPVGSTSVLYLTSDAGEGKTTLINHMAKLQASKYKRKEADWLLVPISLGGRPFLRFDDIVVGFLSNRLRFPLFYFDAFIELVKLGVLIPAFDGFEEMFVQNASGDALSAVGNLVRTLESSGTVLIAARKAYFEYQDVKTQVRLFDSIGSSSVLFARASLKRWERDEFIQYCQQRKVSNCDELYSRVAERLTPKHPLLTRAVLVKQLLDVSESTSTLADLLQSVGVSPNDYFVVFVRAIIEREANEKWIDTSGEAARPLLSVQEHFDLLAMVAQEMWSLSTDNLKSDVLDLLSEVFCDSRKLSAPVAFQIRERTKQHALIVSADPARNTFAFDHEEFKNFFLGEAIGRLCFNADPSRKQELLSVLRRSALPPQASESAIAFVHRQGAIKPERIAPFLMEVAQLDGPSSFTAENVGDLLIGILHGQRSVPMTVKGLSFHPDILRDRSLTNITFAACTFASTSLENTKLTECRFEACHIERFDFDKTTTIENTLIDAECEVASLLIAGRDIPIYDPHAFPQLLREAGFTVLGEQTQAEIKFDSADDPDIKLLRRLLRHLLLRSTHINENVVLRKLGPGAESFLKNVVPRLEKGGILAREWIARDKQSRYYLTVPMERIENSLSAPNLTIDSLIESVRSRQANP